MTPRRDSSRARSSIARHGGVEPDRLQAALRISASPHLRSPASTERIMWSVVASLAPVIGAAVWFFGISALLVVGASTVGAMATERLLGAGGALRAGSLRDGSAAITGILLGLTLPSGFPLWMAFLGGAVGIGFGKLLFGGLGQNPFNPALLGRAFLQAAFPIAITTWPAPTPYGTAGWAAPHGSNLALPLMSPVVDGVTEATPLGLMKFEGEVTETASLLFGTTGGSIGETAALLILLGGLWLAAKRYLDWRIPVATLGTVAVLAALLHAIDPTYPTPQFMLLSGGLMLGAWYMATDLVTSPVTTKGRWIFGAGIGALVVLIRVWGGLPEGVMYAILLMNALVPFLDRATQPKPFGAASARRAKEASA